MTKKMKDLVRYEFLLFSLLLTNACSATPISPPRTPSTLDPQSPTAAHLAELWWVMLALSTAVFVLVVVLLFAALLRGRRATSDTAPDSQNHDVGRRWPIWGGIVMPLVVLAIVFGYTIYTLAAVENSRAQAAVNIKVTGQRWWWEVQYPEQGVTTANEIHIPVGVPVEIQLESSDVIHSFWVPELSGKMDLIPSRVNTLTLQADEAGIYRGECAEYCGLQHAHMGFMVVAESSEDFNAWLTQQQKPVEPPEDPLALQGQDVFLAVGCTFCHSINGLNDKEIDRSIVELGPDLTHISSRLTIAGASLTLNEGNLAGWITDAQHVKPGSLMPNMYLNSQDLNALLAYLATLK
jgi:cytochrome c oxidase subunit II